MVGDVTTTTIRLVCARLPLASVTAYVFVYVPGTLGLTVMFDTMLAVRSPAHRSVAVAPGSTNGVPSWCITGLLPNRVRTGGRVSATITVRVAVATAPSALVVL